MSGDYADLHALAEAATPGPWIYDGQEFRSGCYLTVAEAGGWRIGAPMDAPPGDDDDDRADAAYLAAANPARILALLADLDAARQNLRANDTHVETILDGWRRDEAERDALAAKVEALTALCDTSYPYIRTDDARRALGVTP